MDRCTRCLLPRNYPRTTFDENGVCEYCLAFTPRQLLGEQVLVDTIRRYKRPDAKYDCVVGLSGGRDSTYTLYYLVRQLGMKAAAYTVDHGFLPPETIESVQRAVSVLGVDHTVIKHDHNLKTAGTLLRAWVHKPDPAMVGAICLGCRTMVHKATLEAGSRFGAPVVLGAGEPGSDEYFGARFFSRHSDRPIGKTALLLKMAAKFLANPRYLLNARVPPLLVREYLGHFSPWTPKNVMPVLCFYAYLDWDEKKIQSTIEREVGWKQYNRSDSAWRSDCKLAVLKNQMYLRSWGHTKNDILVSSLVRAGKLTKEEGLARLEAESQYRPQTVEQLCQEIAGIPDLNGTRRTTLLGRA